MKNTILFSFLLALAIGSAKAQTTVNSRIGDTSFFVKYGRNPTQSDDFDHRISVHLEYVLTNLRAAQPNLSTTQQKGRTQVLHLLQQYITLAEYPSNRKYMGQTRPCFIDTVSGNICAVGYLIAQTEGIELAQKINKKYQYEYIKNMKLPEIEAWTQKYGMSPDDCAMIQPSYPKPPPLTPAQIEALKKLKKEQKRQEKIRLKKQRKREIKENALKQKLTDVLKNKTIYFIILYNEYCDTSNEICTYTLKKYQFSGTDYIISQAFTGKNNAKNKFYAIDDPNFKGTLYDEIPLHSFPEGYRYKYKQLLFCKENDTAPTVYLQQDYFVFKDNQWQWMIWFVQNKEAIKITTQHIVKVYIESNPTTITNADGSPNLQTWKIVKTTYE